MLKIVFEDGQYHNEQIKLEFRIDEICFRSMYNAHNFNLHGMLALLLRFVASNFEIVLLLLLVRWQQCFQSNLPKMKAVNYS